MIIDNPKELCYSNYIGFSRALCFDYGDKRIGVAISDINWLIASPFKILPSHGIFNDVFNIFKEYEVKFIVIGAPKTLSGIAAGKQFEKVKKFSLKLEQLIKEKDLDIKIIYWDERFSSVAVSHYFDEAELSLSKRKNNVDKVAASFILQGFLDFVRFKKCESIL